MHAHFALVDACAAVDDDYELLGVAGRGSPLRLEFLEPGGANTGRLLPTGNAVDGLDVPGLGRIEASMVDAANSVLFVLAARLGLTGPNIPLDPHATTDLIAQTYETRDAPAAPIRSRGRRGNAIS